MDQNKYKAYLDSLGEVLEEYALEAKRNKDISIGTKSEDFNTGYLAAFYRVITLMQQHAEPYEIPLEDLSLDKISELDLI